MQQHVKHAQISTATRQTTARPQSTECFRPIGWTAGCRTRGKSSLPCDVNFGCAISAIYSQQQQQQPRPRRPTDRPQLERTAARVCPLDHERRRMRQRGTLTHQTTAIIRLDDSFRRAWKSKQGWRLRTFAIRSTLFEPSGNFGSSSTLSIATVYIKRNDG